MPDAPENQPEDIAPLLRIGLEEDADDAQAQDVDATIRVTVPTPRTGSTGGSGGRSRGWNPPSVEELQKLLPQYEISAFIARGGMGAVYKGQQKTLKRPVAIKVLPPEIEDGDAQFAARFKHEAQAMAQLSHPNIVAVFDAGETQDGLLYFVMEFIEGTDVAQFIASEGQLDPRRAIQITTAVCEALAFAHEEGIIHRDIKPSNIMLDRKGRVKVADFGLAKSVNVEQTLLTGTNMALGTPDFIAPEALIPGIKVDQRADIYAVGVMLYQMLTGHIPRGRFELPSGVVPRVDKGFDPIVDKAMQTDREKRYSSATEMKTAVERVVTVNALEGSAGTPARSHSDGGEAAKKNEAGKNRSEAEIASRRLPEGRAERGNAHAPLKSRSPLLIGTAAVLLVGGVAWMLLDEPTAAQGLPKSEAEKLAGITSLASATKDTPFLNSLGMKFVPVPIMGGPTGGRRVLFSIWETRVKDYEAFVAATKRQWDRSHDLPQGAEYPALDVSWHDAVAFCEWLTSKEQKAGLIGSQARYRLPSDHEWSCAAGNEYEDAAKPPAEKTIKRPIYPWGMAWPPPEGENLRGEEAAGSKTGSGLEIITGHRDPYPTSAPVGLSKANDHGLFDLGGNAGEWCEDWYDASQKERVSRGATINSGNRITSQSDYRAHYVPEMHSSSNGFRVVLDEAEALKAAGLSSFPSSPVSQSLTALPAPIENSPAPQISKSSPFPPGQWVRPFAALEDLHANWTQAGTTFVDGWITPGAGTNHSITLAAPNGRGKNWGVRARYRWHDKGTAVLPLRRSGKAADNTVATYEFRVSGGSAGFRRCQANGIGTEPNFTPLGETGSVELVPGTEVLVEAFAIGDTLYGRVNGRLFQAASDHVLEEGGFEASALQMSYRDIEFINLDGLNEAEALKAAGVGE